MNTEKRIGRPRERRGRRGAFAENLISARQALGLTQRELAEALVVHPVSLARWESGSSRPSTFARYHVERWIEQALAAGAPQQHGEGSDR